MKRALSAAAALALVLTWAQPAASEDLASSIVGVWKNTSFVRKEVATGTGSFFLLISLAQDRRDETDADWDVQLLNVFRKALLQTEGDNHYRGCNVGRHHPDLSGGNDEQ